MSHALGIDDRWLGELSMRKVLVRHRHDQRLAVRVQLFPVADRDAWERVSKRGNAPTVARSSVAGEDQ